MTNFIEWYPNALSKNNCDELIEIYEKSQKQRFENQLKPQFSQVTLDETQSSILSVGLKPVFQAYFAKYPDLPKMTNMELFRIKKYEPNTTDQFDWHSDSVDVSSSRYLALLLYLNPVDAGGETQFRTEKYKPTTGGAIIFPPYWTHTHRGCPVTGTKAKYILSTYLRF